MVMSLISTPLFRTNNTEKLEVADAYDLTSTRPINKIYEASKGVANQAIDRAGGLRGLANGLTNLMSLKTSGATGRQMLESGLGMFNTSTIGILRNVGDTVLDKAGAFIDMDPSLVNKIKTTGESVARQMQYGNPTDITNYGNLLGLVGDLSGNPEFARMINIGYESAVWGAAFTEAAGYGAFDYSRDVKQYIDPEVYRQAMIYSLPVVAASGSLEATQHVITELGAETVITHKPDYIKVFLGRFKLPETRPADIPTYANLVVDTMSQLNPRWYLVSRGGEDIYDLSALAGASTDAVQTLDNHAVIGPLIQIAPYFPEVTTDEVLREQYPLMVTNLS
jgi:hypothetical protein